MANITIPNLPAAIALSGQEEIEVVQANTSKRAFLSQLGGFFPSATSFFIYTSGTLQYGVQYGFETDVSAWSVTLPALSSTYYGIPIWLYDVGDNAYVNNVTITAAGTDKILVYGSSVSSTSIAINNTGFMLVPRSGGWRLINIGN